VSPKVRLVFSVPHCKGDGVVFFQCDLAEICRGRARSLVLWERAGLLPSHIEEAQLLRNASTSISNLEISSSFSLRTS